MIIYKSLCTVIGKSTKQMYLSIWIFKFDLFHVEITAFSALILDFNKSKKTKGPNFSKFSDTALQLKHYIYVLIC